MKEEAAKNDLQEDVEEVKDKFSQLMFGPRKTAKRESELTSPAQQGHELPYLQLMSQLEDIYTSIQDLKPVISEFSPMLDFLKKKVKS